jgi:hypothetical protein
MPITLLPRPQDSGPKITLRGNIIKDIEYKYKYPNNLKLKPGSQVHDTLRDEIMLRANASRDEMQNRYPTWQKMDEQLTAYIPLDAEDKKVQAKDETKPVKIVVPVTYAVLETLLTYMVGAFLDDPIFKYEGHGPEDVIGAMLLEHNISLQTNKARMGLALHTMFRDSFVYGFGAVSPCWTTKLGYRRVAREEGFFSSLGGFLRTGEGRKREVVVKYEGNELHNVNPYSLFPDTSVGIHEIQRGEYVGFIRRENLMEVLSREKTDVNFFNGQYLKNIDGRSTLGGDLSKRDRNQVSQDYSHRGDKNTVDVIYMYINLIPADWGLGAHTYPERWLFALAGDNVLLQAQPLDLDHNMTPLVTCAPEFDGYTISPVSKIEMVYGMQHLVNFLYNSHIANVRKAIHDMLVIDPQMINTNDLEDASPGKYIRLRRKAWGRGVQGSFEQLRITDITGPHLGESSMIMNMIHNVTGATDAVQGIARKTSERVSATEFNQTRSGALGRLERSAKMAAIMTFADLGEMIASQTQQFMSEDTFIKIQGRYAQELQEEFGDVTKVPVTPADLLIDYDILVNDGTLPSSGDPNIWLQIFQTVVSDPLIRQGYDDRKIFTHMAKLLGAKNIHDFVRRGAGVQAQVLPNEEVEKGVERGNLVPIGGE